MGDLLDQLKKLVASGEILISAHGYDELANDGISIKDAIRIEEAVLIAEYPDHGKGPCVLVLQKDRNNLPVHVVWGIPSGKGTPAVVVTAYRPNPEAWEGDFITRKKR